LHVDCSSAIFIAIDSIIDFTWIFYYILSFRGIYVFAFSLSDASIVITDNYGLANALGAVLVDFMVCKAVD